MDDLPVFNCDNRDEPVVIVRTARENLAMHFIFEDHDATFRGAMNDQCIARMKLDRLPVSRETGHQISSTSNRHRPTGEVIAGLEDCPLCESVEVMFGINQ